MSYLTTQPEALTAAAGNLQTIGASLAAQNASAAAPTTGVAPAAADEVSALQATLYSAYGTLYQQISAEATAVHEMLVSTLGANANSYAAAEAANSAATGLAGSGTSSGLLGLLTGDGSFGLLSSAVGNGSVIAAMQAGNFGSAASDFLQLGTSGFLAPGALDGEAPSAAVLAGSNTPTGAAGVGPVGASAGQASSIGRLSVPPAWVATATAAAPATSTGAGWTAPAPSGTPVTTLPAGMPSVATAGREGLGFGTPRYGVKPTVMGRRAVG